MTDRCFTWSLFENLCSGGRVDQSAWHLLTWDTGWTAVVPCQAWKYARQSSLSCSPVTPTDSGCFGGRVEKNGWQTLGNFIRLKYYWYPLIDISGIYDLESRRQSNSPIALEVETPGCIHFTLLWFIYICRGDVHKYCMTLVYNYIFTQLNENPLLLPVNLIVQQINILQVTCSFFPNSWVGLKLVYNQILVQFIL